jgi:hypothetical protein
LGGLVALGRIVVGVRATVASSNLVENLFPIGGGVMLIHDGRSGIYSGRSTGQYLLRRHPLRLGKMVLRVKLSVVLEVIWLVVIGNWTRRAYERGRVTRQHVQRCARDWLVDGLYVSVELEANASARGASFGDWHCGLLSSSD